MMKGERFAGCTPHSSTRHEWSMQLDQVPSRISMLPSGGCVVLKKSNYNCHSLALYEESGQKAAEVSQTDLGIEGPLWGLTYHPQRNVLLATQWTGSFKGIWVISPDLQGAGEHHQIEALRWVYSVAVLSDGHIVLTGRDADFSPVWALFTPQFELVHNDAGMPILTLSPASEDYSRVEVDGYDNIVVQHGDHVEIFSKYGDLLTILDPVKPRSCKDQFPLADITVDHNSNILVGSKDGSVFAYDRQGHPIVRLLQLNQVSGSYYQSEVERDVFWVTSTAIKDDTLIIGIYMYSLKMVYQPDTGEYALDMAKEEYMLKKYSLC